MKKHLCALCAALLLCLALPVTVSANSVGNPYLTVLVEHPPAGLELTLLVESEGSQETHATEGQTMLWEGYYRFYSHIWNPWSPEGSPQPTALLQVDTGTESFSLPVEPQGFTYDGNLVTLDLANRRLLYGQPWWRPPLLISLRVVLTLALEGAVFWLFGYRTRRSWLVFLLVNLVTQGAVNVAMHCLLPTGTSIFLVFAMFFYTPMELTVLLVEIAAFAFLLKERSRRRSAACAACANLLSWILGGLLMAAFLPF